MEKKTDSLELVKGNFIRDITSIDYMSRGEARRRLDGIIELERMDERLKVLNEELNRLKSELQK
jgi:hypothetical protein